MIYNTLSFVTRAFFSCLYSGITWTMSLLTRKQHTTNIYHCILIAYCCCTVQETLAVYSTYYISGRAVGSLSGLLCRIGRSRDSRLSKLVNVGCYLGQCQKSTSSFSSGGPVPAVCLLRFDGCKCLHRSCSAETQISWRADATTQCVIHGDWEEPSSSGLEKEMKEFAREGLCRVEVSIGDNLDCPLTVRWVYRKYASL